MCGQCRRCKRHGKMAWRRAWLPTPVFLPGECYGQKRPMGCSPWGRTDSDTAEATWHAWMGMENTVFSNSQVFPLAETICSQILHIPSSFESAQSLSKRNTQLRTEPPCLHVGRTWGTAVKWLWTLVKGCWTVWLEPGSFAHLEPSGLFCEVVFTSSPFHRGRSRSLERWWDSLKVTARWGWAGIDWFISLQYLPLDSFPSFIHYGWTVRAAATWKIIHSFGLAKKFI